jgi:hypothetical protein
MGTRNNARVKLRNARQAKRRELYSSNPLAKESLWLHNMVIFGQYKTGALPKEKIANQHYVNYLMGYIKGKLKRRAANKRARVSRRLA